MEATLFLGGPDDTRRLGKWIGRRLAGDALIALTGPLGAGKTCLTQGLAEGLGIPKETAVVSPTFTLANEYRGERSRLHHLDVYRLGVDDFYESGLDEYFDRPGVTVIEWADRLEGELPEPRLEIDIALSGTGRKAAVKTVGLEFESLIEELIAAFEAGPKENDSR